jgi:hypothetical protein
MGRRKILELESKIRKLNDTIVTLTKKFVKDSLTIDEAKKRDYIVRTNGIGKMKDKKLIADFKEEFSDYNDILNFEFSRLEAYYDKLKLFEQKQIVIDVYGAKS